MIKWDELPLEIQEKMLQRQVEQGNPRDPSVFEKQIDANIEEGGFDWYKTYEGSRFWAYIIWDVTTGHFYTLYPKTQKHISSYDELIIGQYYWIKLSDKWYPALYKFNDNFVIDGATAVPKEIISLEHIEILKHE